jgi:hypothetical protein
MDFILPTIEVSRHSGAAQQRLNRGLLVDRGHGRPGGACSRLPGATWLTTRIVSAVASADVVVGVDTASLIDRWIDERLAATRVRRARRTATATRCRRHASTVLFSTSGGRASSTKAGPFNWGTGNADRVGCRSPPHWRPLPRRHGRRPACPERAGGPEGGRCRSLIPCPAGEVQSGHGRENRDTS